MIDEGSVAALVAAVRAYLRVEGTAEQALLERVAASAVALGEAFTGCVFVRRTVEERVALASGWLAYRQQLRDITAQDPDAVVWPTAPAQQEGEPT